jgi:hypothetical protein
LSGNTASGAVVVKGGMGVSGNVYMSDASSANGVTISSTLQLDGTSLVRASGNSAGRTSTVALRSKGSAIFESNVLFGTGIPKTGIIYVDNATNVIAGNISTGGLVLGNSTALVGASISGDVNIGTDDSGSLYILNKENAFGTPISGTLTPYAVSLAGGSGAIQLGAITALGGMNVFNDTYIGQPHSLNNINGWTAQPGVTTNNYQTLSTNPYFGTPIGAASGNVYLTSGARGLSYTSGALQIKTVYFADGSQSDGGAGIAGNLWVNRAGFIGTLGSSTNYGNLVAASSTESTAGGNGATGSLVVLGGAGIASKLNVGGVIAANAAVPTTGKTTGAIVIPAGGMGVSGGISAGNISLDAGTVTQEPLLIPAGAVLTNPKLGAVEFASNVWYATPAPTSRAVIPVSHFFAVGANSSLNGGTTITATNTGYSVFGGASNTAGQIVVLANTVYEFELKVLLGFSATPGSSTMQFAFGGNITPAWYHYDTTVTGIPYVSGTGASSPTTTPSIQNFAGTTTLPSVTSGVVLAAGTTVNRSIMVRGMFAVGTNTSTIVPQVAFGSAISVIVQALPGSYWRVTPVSGASSTFGAGNFITS